MASVQPYLDPVIENAYMAFFFSFCHFQMSITWLYSDVSITVFESMERDHTN